MTTNATAKKNRRKSASQRIREVLVALQAEGRNLHTVSYQEVVRRCKQKLKGEARKNFNPERSLVSALKRPLTGGWKKPGRPTNADLGI